VLRIDGDAFFIVALVRYGTLLLMNAGDALRIPVEMLIVFGAAKLLAELFERIGQPGLVGEILAGVIIGPSVLGWIAPNEILGALANLGAMFLLFEVGLEVKSSELLKVGRTATLVATLGVVVPFLSGWGILLLWGKSHTEGLFVGAAMVATSVGITARILSSHGWLQERASKIILAAAVIDDVQGLIVLAVVSSVAKGNFEVLPLSVTAVLALAFTWIAAKWGTRSMAIVISHVPRQLRVGEAQFALSMLLLFGLSAAAAFVGVAAIVGAFLAGLALAENVETRVKYLTHGVTELLVPFFLVGIGLQVDPAVFVQGPIAALAVVLVLAAVASKLAGCGLGAIGLGRVDALRVGIGMIPRGEVGTVVAQLGLALGVIERNIYSVVVVMAVATTMIPLPFLKLAYAGAPKSLPAEIPPAQA
jgi:Na+:H+ antiporter